MKKIGIDARLYSQTGVGTYLRNLLDRIDKNPKKGVEYYVYLTNKDYRKTAFRSKKMIKRKADFMWHGFKEQWNFLNLLKSDNLDLVHFTYFGYPVLYDGKFVATVHDITPFLFKTGRSSTKSALVYNLKHFVFKLILKTQLGRSLKIIVPSHMIKNQLNSFFRNETEGKVAVISEGVGRDMVEAKENKDLLKKFSNFFIYVGNFYPHKNVESLVKAFAIAANQAKLVLIGPDDFFGKRLLSKINDYKNIVFVKNAKPDDLVFFYKNAKALIHPSLSEGFGLPLIEAAYFGCPIIASNIGVFKELLKDNYVSFEPRSIEDMAFKIKNFSNVSLKPFPKAFFEKHSFDKMAAETVEVYLNCLR